MKLSSFRVRAYDSKIMIKSYFINLIDMKKCSKNYYYFSNYEDYLFAYDKITVYFDSFPIYITDFRSVFHLPGSDSIFFVETINL